MEEHIKWEADLYEKLFQVIEEHTEHNPLSVAQLIGILDLLKKTVDPLTGFDNDDFNLN